MLSIRVENVSSVINLSDKNIEPRPAYAWLDALLDERNFDSMVSFLLKLAKYIIYIIFSEVDRRAGWTKNQ